MSLEAVMLAGYIAASLVQGAVGGWMGSLVPKENDSRLGAWFAVSNTGAEELMALFASETIHRLPPDRRRPIHRRRCAPALAALRVHPRSACC